MSHYFWMTTPPIYQDPPSLSHPIIFSIHNFRLTFPLKLSVIAAKHKETTDTFLFPRNHCIYFFARIYLFKVNNGDTTKICEIYSKLTIKTPPSRQLHIQS